MRVSKNVYEPMNLPTLFNDKIYNTVIKFVFSTVHTTLYVYSLRLQLAKTDNCR